ncbi:MAG TPA: hypothetical protein VIG67_09500 [Yaniella sp.]
MSDERARAINTLRDIATAFQNDHTAHAEELLDALGPEASHGRPSTAQVAVVALESLDSWYESHQLLNGAVRFVQRDIPRAMQNATTAIDALATKGRALRSTSSLLQRNPEHAVAGAGAYLVSAAVKTLSTQRDASFEAVLEELLPAQEVSEPVPEDETPAEEPTPASDDVVEIVDETAETPGASADDPEARYTAIVETRFMAGVKEFFQWMGESHAVTGTGLPKRADIQDVAATIDIDAEGVAKKPAEDEAAATDLDLSLPAAQRPTRYVTSAQAIPELMAFWTTLQETDLVEIKSTKVQPSSKASTFGFEEFDQLEAAEELVATYVYQTLTLDADAEAAADTAKFITNPETIEDTQTVLIPRLRQLEAVGLLDIVDGQPVIPAPLRPAVEAGVQRI